MKKVVKMICVFEVVLLFSTLLSGCTWDFKDINQKSILTAVAVDKKDGLYHFLVEIANIEAAGNSENKGGSGNKYKYTEGHGTTISEAREDLDRQLDKEVHLSAVRALILTENFAKEHLVEYLYRLRTDQTYRKKTITVITREDPEDLFKKLNEQDLSLGFYTDDLLKTLEEGGETFTRTTTRLLENLSDRYTGVLIPCIGLRGKNVALIGYSVIYDTTIVGFIPMEEANSLVFMKADGKPKFDYVVPYQTNQFTIEVELKNKKIKPSYKNGIIHFDMAFHFETKLLYGQEKTPYHLTETDNRNITRSLEEILKTELVEAVDQAQKKFKCDYLQFDDEFRIKFPSQFKNMDWQTEFENLTYNIEVDAVLSDNEVIDYETGEQK